jgi:predicted AAA+ superfamily ATPase
MKKIDADLSRRAVLYEMPGLSFREFLLVQNLTDSKPFTFDEVIHHHQVISRDIAKALPPLRNFSEYLHHGYYPFFTEGVQSYPLRLTQSIRTVLESDMASIEGYDVRNANVLLRLLYILAGSVPFKPNIALLAKRTDIHANTVVKYLHYLEQARILSFLMAPNKGMSLLQKPDKLYLDNSNLAYALRGQETSIGSVRELFFHNQVRQVASLHYSTEADFVVNEVHLFEIGGPSKAAPKNKNIYLVRDGIDHGVGNVIPLWLFGFLY